MCKNFAVHFYYCNNCNDYPSNSLYCFQFDSTKSIVDQRRQHSKQIKSKMEKEAFGMKAFYVSFADSLTHNHCIGDNEVSTNDRIK